MNDDGREFGEDHAPRNGAGGWWRRRRAARQEAWRGHDCANCGAALRGPFCHVCGQPDRSPIRSILALGGDAFEYLADADSRLLRTLKSLVLHPGRLTEGYLAGQRMRFVRPVRIYLVVSALLFIAVSWGTGVGSLDDEDAPEVRISAGSQGLSIGPIRAGTDAPTDTGASEPRSADADPAGLPAQTEQLGETAEPPAKPEATRRKGPSIHFNDDEWHPVDNPLRFGWLPESANAELNRLVGVIRNKAQEAQRNPARLGREFFRALPTTLFILLPVFALLLKIVLVFKRRLYMEHLMVAVHSHTFIYLGILLAMALFQIASAWPAGWFNPWYTVMGLAIAWIPLNLLITQKRVYRQGWIGAVFCFALVGIAYLVLVSFTALAALVLSLVNL